MLNISFVLRLFQKNNISTYSTGGDTILPPSANLVNHHTRNEHAGPSDFKWSLYTSQLIKQRWRVNDWPRAQVSQRLAKGHLHTQQLRNQIARITCPNHEHLTNTPQ
jgi:hypothetical protein